MSKKELAQGALHEVPDDMVKALTSKTELIEKWNSLTPLARNEWICWNTIVKKAETRKEHIKRMCEEISRGQAPTLLLAWLPSSK